MNQFIHPDFQLNGKSYSYIELLAESLFLKNNGNLFEKSIGNFLMDWLNEENFILVKTSGSTGKPKQIVLQKEAMIASANATIQYFELQPKCSALLCLSADYIGGKMMLVRALTCGLHLDTMEPSSNPLENSNKVYDFVAMVPMQISASIDKLNQIKTLIIGGAKVNYQLAAEILKTNCNAFETYGMTETISHIAVKKIGEQAFTILPNVTISVDDRNCLNILVPTLSKEKIATNDIVELLTEKQFIFKGRFDNVINSGGVKIFPEVIEAKLEKYISNRFFISSKSDEKFGEKVVLIVEGEKQVFDSSIFESLSKFEIPKEILFVEKFVETETNKINRKKTVEKWA